MESIEIKYVRAFLNHHEFVKGVAFRYAPYPGLVDDVVQQVFTELLQRKDEWDFDRDLRPLLTVMTRNIARRAWREKIRSLPPSLQRIADRINELIERNEREPSYEEDRRLLHFCLDQLPEKSRKLIDIRYFEKVPTRTIAEQLKLQSNSVSRALVRIREKLKKCIEYHKQEEIADAF